jgi:hypothetical protein
MSRLLILSGALTVLGVLGAFVTSSGAGPSVPRDPERVGQTPQAAGRPVPGSLGTWKRVLGRDSITLAIGPERLTCTIVEAEERHPKPGTSVEFLADYSVSKDGILYGLISSATVRGDESDREELLWLERALIDAPLSIRIRVDEDTLTVKDFRMGLLGGRMDEKRVAFYTGRYAKQPPATPQQP